MLRLKYIGAERGGSVVECLTWDRRVVGSSLTCIVSLRRTFYPLISTGSTQQMS